MAVTPSENFGIIDVLNTGTSIQITVRHFDKHGHPYGLLSYEEAGRLISSLERAIKTKPEPPKVEEMPFDPGDFSF